MTERHGSEPPGLDVRFARAAVGRSSERHGHTRYNILKPISCTFKVSFSLVYRYLTVNKQ